MSSCSPTGHLGTEYDNLDHDHSAYFQTPDQNMKVAGDGGDEGNDMCFKIQENDF